MILSQLAETLIGSEIVKLAGEIREKIRKGEKIYNYTVGDFDPAIFSIPPELKQEIITAYNEGYTNYPAAEGNLELRESLCSFLNTFQGLEYQPDELLVSAGGRPLIYAFFRAIADKGDGILYAVPSWNNNHYTHFVEGRHLVVEARPENKFMPTADELRPYIQDATILALCSPQNPTGTTFSREALEEICDMVLEENARRGDRQKKLYVMYDQMYGHLTYGNIKHYDPVSLRPGMKAYTVYIDAISKMFSATGVRVGWCMGPATVVSKMKAILTHVGAWAPMAEQKACARFMLQTDAINNFLSHFKAEAEERLRKIYDGFLKLKEEGLPVDAIAPESGIYLTIKIDCVGKRTASGKLLETQPDVTDYLLNEARLAVVPFYAFGAAGNSPWYRLSIGTCRKETICEMFDGLDNALKQLQ